MASPPLINKTLVALEDEDGLLLRDWTNGDEVDRVCKDCDDDDDGLGIGDAEGCRRN